MNTDIKCPKCGAAVSGDSLYCNYCGAAITDVRDLLKKKAELNLQKEENDEELRVEQSKHKMHQAKSFTDILILIIGLGAIIFMCLMASR